ncbi:MAG: 1-deoxy-D-xylulose-5-phosphate synthase [Oscillospiraceae bacterium]|nr:1-deoxy-D-xylulose-5-phosphate synthase [Oscillospiraceae bacterium]
MENIRYLDKIEDPGFVKDLPEDELPELCAEIRRMLTDTVSHTGGHLASNLGVVELTVAMHRIFDSPRDHFVWDVGHQMYTHKLLTGRFERFATLRTENGLSGFSRPSESAHDVFYSGHSSTSVSAALGLASAKKLRGDDSHTVCVLGDGSFTGGMIYEAMNNAGRSDIRMIVILNDNEMSISQNVGALARYLSVIRSKPEYFKLKEKTEKALKSIPLVGEPIAEVIFNLKTIAKNSLYNSNLFEDLGFRYMGPVDGHNTGQLCEALESAKLVDMPVLLHVYTTKGKGYDPAEREPTQFHGITKFDIDTGEPLPCGTSFSEQFGDFLCDVAAKDESVCAITAAMSVGTGLRRFEELYPDRFFDVGIAEQHAVTFASGLSKQGMKPVVAVYSTFLQRAYDQILHDGALQKQKLVLAIDRAGFVGEDGETHQGIYDVAFLNSIPDVTVYSPSSYGEMKAAIGAALYNGENLVAVRYPRGREILADIERARACGTFDIYGDPDADTAIVTYGRIFGCAAQAVKRMGEKSVKLVKLNRVKPLDGEAAGAVMDCKRVFFFEEGVRSAGVGEKFAAALLQRGFRGKYKLTAVEDEFVKQASVAAQLRKYKLDADGMVGVIEN